MGSSRRSASPGYTFDEEEGRPLVIDYNSTNRYRPGQVVYFGVAETTQLEGPYKIETYAGPRQYTLCYFDGQQARNGDVVGEDDLKEKNEEA